MRPAPDQSRTPTPQGTSGAASRLTINEALTVARDPAGASAFTLMEAKRTLMNTRADADQGLAAIVCEMRKRSAFNLDGITYAIPMPRAAE